MTEPLRQDRTGSRKPRRRKQAGRLLKSFLAALLIVVGGITGYYYISSRTFRDTLNTTIARTDTPERAFPGRSEVNILLMGRDLDRDRHGRIVHTRGRTDAMMLAHIDFKGRTASILSIPRDTLVHIPGYRGKRRVSYANALGGPELALDTIEEFLGVRPDHYVLVNFDAFEKAIDAIGGLEVTVDKQLDYDDNWGNLHIHLKPGRQLLNGDQCMGFVRYRQSNDGEGESDLVRIGRQQELIRAAQARLANPRVMFRVPRALDIIRNDIKGDLTHAQMVCLAKFLRSLPSDSGVRMETIPALNKSGIFVRADPEATKDLVSQMFFDNQP